MILLLDVGNTRIKWASLEGDQLVHGGEVAYRDRVMASVLDQEWSGLQAPRSVVISSVTGRAGSDALTSWLAHRWDAPVHFATAQHQQLGVKNGYRDPARLGVDRWLALLAARARYSKPACVVDFGSALTIDAMNDTGEHLGGLIVPGLRTMHRSLTVGDISLDAGEVLACSAEFTMGRDTAEAVGYGIQQCLTLFVDGVCDRLARSFRDEPERIVTGGDAVLLLPLLNDRYHHIPNLVLEGLALVAREVSGDHA